MHVLMETFIAAIDFLILAFIMAMPIALLILLKKLKTKHNFLLYVFISLLILGMVIIFFAWWSDFSSFLLMKHYGYSLDGMDEAEFYKNVLPQNVERVQQLQRKIMGIGWSLKAMFGFVMVLPYVIVVYILKIIMSAIKNKMNKE